MTTDIEKITDEKLPLHRQINIITERIHELNCIMQDINEGFDNEFYVTGGSENNYSETHEEKINLELTLNKYKEKYPEYFI